MQERLLKIDVSSKSGLRDFALLLVLFTTGRRAGEVASLRRRHLQVNRRGIVTLDFERLKGAKSTRDTLDEVVSTVLILLVQTAYNTPLKDIESGAAIGCTWPTRHALRSHWATRALPVSVGIISIPPRCIRRATRSRFLCRRLGRS